MMGQKTNLKELIGKSFDRKFQIKKEDIDVDNRTINLSFASEAAEVDRWYGKEILEISKSAVDLKRLNQRGPLLVNHDRGQHIGAVLRAYLDEKDKKARAEVKFSRSNLGEENFQDVQDEIKVNVSCRYNIREIKLIETRKDDIDVYKVTKWEPVEVSLEAIAADTSVGIGRNLETKEITNNLDKTNNIEEEIKTMGERTSTNTPKDHGQPPAIDLNAERSKMLEMMQMGEKFNQRDLASKFIQEGKNKDELGTAILETMRSNPIEKPNENTNDIGLTSKEQRSFSFLKAIRACADGDWRGAEFEKEVSLATQKQNNRTTNGFLVPYEVLRAAPTAATTNTKVNQGAIIDTVLMVESFIELIRNKLVTRRLGAKVLTGLVGDLAIPKQTGGAAAYWVKEGNPPKGSKIPVGQVPLEPNTIGAFTDLTRRLLLQSSIDIENFVRNDLAAVIALGIDRAVIMGSGVDDEPKGLLTMLKDADRIPKLGPNGSALDFKNIVNLETIVATDNADIGTLAYLTNAKVRGQLKTTEKAANTAQFLWTNRDDGDGMLNGYKAAVTNQVPSNLLDKGLNALIFGNWADVIIGEWGILDVQVNPYVDDGTAGTVRIRTLQDADVAVRHIESFSAYTDIKT